MGNVLLGFIILLILMDFYCAWKADEIYLPYKTFNVFGKFKAYLFVNFICVAFMGVIGVIYFLTSKNSVDNSQILGAFLFIPLGIAIAILVYKSAKNNCPDDPLKDNLAKNMFMAGAGYSARFMFFFINFVGEAAFAPKRAVDDKGREIYIFPDDNVYDKDGRFVGKKTDSDRYIRVKD